MWSEVKKQYLSVNSVKWHYADDKQVVNFYKSLIIESYKITHLNDF